jgi:hypothetical protein
MNTNQKLEAIQVLSDLLKSECIFNTEEIKNKYGFKPESEEEIRKKIITIVKTL